MNKKHYIALVVVAAGGLWWWWSRRPRVMIEEMTIDAVTLNDDSPEDEAESRLFQGGIMIEGEPEITYGDPGNSDPGAFVDDLFPEHAEAKISS